jgi:hypothetical protein
MVNKTYSYSKKLIISISALVVIGAIGVGVMFIITNNRELVKTAEVSDKPAFHYDRATSPGWYGGVNNWPNMDDYTGDQIAKDDLPVVSTTVSQGESGKPSDCFVNYFYWDKQIDPVVALEEMKKFTVGAGDALYLETITTHTISMDTPEGVKEFQLHQYNLAGSGSDQVAKGAEFGFVPLSKGYIDIRGYCNQSSQLSTTLPAILSVSLKDQ